MTTNRVSHSESPPIDESFIEKLSEFEVLDVWNEDESNEIAKKIKKEPEEPKKSRSRSRDNKSSRERRSSDERSRRSDRSFGSHSRRRSKSRDRPRIRNRSPERKRSARSPPRHSKSFLDELKQTLEKQGQDTSFIDAANPSKNSRGYRQRNYKRNYQPNLQQEQFYIQQQHYSYQQQFTPMEMQYQQQFNAPQIPMMGYDVFGNAVIQSTGMMMQAQMQPQPVPPPQIASTSFSETNESFNSLESPGTSVKPKPLLKKTVNSGLNLTEILKQKAKQQGKDNSSAVLTSFKEKVKEKCKNASKILADLEAKKQILPLKCTFTKVQMPLVRQLQSSHNRSPLLLNDHNVQFLFQTAPSRCRTAFERNPLKNLFEPSETLLPLARNMNMNLMEMSMGVKNRSFIIDYQQVKQEATKQAEISKPVTSKKPQKPSNLKIKSTLVQTDPLDCERCLIRSNIRTNSKSVSIQTQKVLTNDVKTQCTGLEEDKKEKKEGVFSCTLYPEQITNMSYKQRDAFKTFCSEFNINFTDPITTTFHNRHSAIEMPYFRTEIEDDRMNYTNPENPRYSQQESFHVSYSPPPMNFKAHIFNRVGDFVRDPRPSFEFSEYKIPSPGRRGSRSPLLIEGRNHSRSPSQSSTTHYNRSPSRSSSTRRSRSPMMRRARSPSWNRDYRGRRGRY